ncbi:type I secretion system permease/ATPase [Caballeronia sp. LjRoot34]|uniref:type I secretion system permease/ATPase n=1 Tax=Caballeronia sp. LjRoot34 TaxID=3342325 RepID=UPI003ECCFC3F
MKNEVPGAITPIQPDGDDALALSTKVDDTLLKSLVWMAAYHGKPTSEAAMLSGLPAGRFISPKQAQLAMEQSGFNVGVVERQPNEVSPMLLPVILFRKDHGGCVLLGRAPNDVKVIKPAAEIKEGQQPAQDEMEAAYLVVLPETGSKVVSIGVSQLKANYTGFAMLVKPVGKVDIRAGIPEEKSDGHWLLSTLWRYRRYYWSAALGALLINVLALAGTFFTMNVYDRVVPNQAFVTLWSLAIGVAIAMLFEFIARNVRAHVLDVAGKKADLIMGAMLFKKALAIRMEHKPASSGSFANQLREFESVRDFVASATLATLSDLPFTFLYIAVIFMIGGMLGFIPLLLVPVIIGVSVLIQWPLKKVMKENLRESSLKQGVLIESVEGIETLKATGGERYMQERWELFSAKASDTSMKSKHLSALAMNFVSWITQFETVMIVVAGVYMISAGKLTQGALIGSVILASRALAPLAQVAGLAVRFQQAKAALDSLSGLMKKPVERDPDVQYLNNPGISGAIELRQVGFHYPVQNGMKPPEFLKNINIDIRAGERVAILGRVGSGKSSLLRVMSNLYRPTSGQVFSDGIDITQVDPADWREKVGYVSQDSRLFYGSLRQNVMIGRPDASIHELLRVAKLTGLDAIAAGNPHGWNMQIGENGDGLSGGQKQLVAIARCLIARPTLILMDEPTSAMDTQTESAFIRDLAEATRGTTLVVVTHRPSLLQLVDRIVVIDAGKVVTDGPKEEVLAALRNPAAPAVSHAQGTDTQAHGAIKEPS